jgi:hypothetical protein
MTHRPIFEIARDIKRTWTKPYFGAVPYLDAMRSLSSINDYYYEDSARSVVAYFLANASTFRGPEAKALKQELKDALK